MPLNQNVLDSFVSYLKKKHKNILQDLLLEECTDEQGMYVKLNLIKIKKSQRHKGYGSSVMYELCAFADLYNVRIKLYATNLYGSDLKALYAFYGKHSFVLIKNDNIGEMLYYPVLIKNKKVS